MMPRPQVRMFGMAYRISYPRDMVASGTSPNEPTNWNIEFSATLLNMIKQTLPRSYIHNTMCNRSRVGRGSAVSCLLVGKHLAKLLEQRRRGTSAHLIFSTSQFSFSFSDFWHFFYLKFGTEPRRSAAVAFILFANEKNSPKRWS